MIRSRAALVLSVSVLMLGLAGCSSGSGDAEKTGTSEKPAASTSASPAATEDAAEDPGKNAVLVSSAPDGSPTIAIGASAMAPATISVAPGTTITFTSGDGGPHGVKIGSLDSYSVAKNFPEYFRFDEAGTYKAYDEISESTAVITVK